MDALVKDEVSKAIAEAAQGPILAGVNRVFGLLRRAGLMRNQRIEPQFDRGSSPKSRRLRNLWKGRT